MTARIIYAAVNMSQNLSLETQSTGIRRKKTKTAAQEIGPYRIPPNIFGIVLAARFRCGFCQNRDVFVSPFCFVFFSFAENYPDWRNQIRERFRGDVCWRARAVVVFEEGFGWTRAASR